MADWLKRDYGFSDAEVSQIIGPAIEYRIAKIAANKVEVFAMLPKKILQGLTRITQP